METRKRAASQRVSTIVEGKSKRESSGQKPSKLTLKVTTSPSAASPPSSTTLAPPSGKRAKRSSPLEECAQLETSEDVLKHLVMINEAHLPNLVESLPDSVRVLRDLWRRFGELAPLCSVVARLLSSLVVRSESLPQYLQEFLLSMIEHGTCLYHHHYDDHMVYL